MPEFSFNPSLDPQQLKGASAVLMITRPQILVPDTIENRAEEWSEPHRMVSAIDAYLQCKPLQRTLTQISSIEKIPLIRVPLSGSTTKVKAGNSVTIDAVSVENGVLSGTPANAVLKLQSELEKQRALSEKFARMFSNLYAQMIAMKKDDESFDYMFPSPNGGGDVVVEETAVKSNIIATDSTKKRRRR